MNCNCNHFRCNHFRRNCITTVTSYLERDFKSLFGCEIGYVYRSIRSVTHDIVWMVSHPLWQSLPGRCTLPMIGASSIFVATCVDAFLCRFQVGTATDSVAELFRAQSLTSSV
eukprot:5870480-Amphidinium_carterae.2